MEKEFQKRVDYDGDIKPVLDDVCRDFDLGNYKAHKIITMGYGGILES